MTGDETLDVAYVNETQIEMALANGNLWEGSDDADLGVTGAGTAVLTIDVTKFIGRVSIDDYGGQLAMTATIHGAGDAQPFPFGISVHLTHPASSLTFTGQASHFTGRVELDALAVPGLTSTRV